MNLPRDLAGDIPGLAGPHLEAKQVQALMTVVGGGVLSVRLCGHDRVRLVSSATANGAFYLVTDDACSCADFEHRGGPCKHMLSLRVAHALELEQEPLPF